MDKHINFGKCCIFADIQLTSEPKNEGTKNLKGNTVGSEGDRGLKGVSVLVVEAALAGSEDDGGNQGSKTTSHVNDTRSGKVDVSNITERVGVKSREEAIGTPDGVHNDGVDETGKEERVAKVGSHLTTLIEKGNRMLVGCQSIN